MVGGPPPPDGCLGVRFVGVVGGAGVADGLGGDAVGDGLTEAAAVVVEIGAEGAG